MTKPLSKSIVRACPTCGLDKELAFFNHLPYDTRCDLCVPTKLSQQIVEKKLIQVRKDSNDLVSALTESATLPRIDQLLGEFFHRYGGAGKFVETMVQDMKDLEKTKGGTIALFDRKMGLLKLTAQSTKMLDDREIDQMTDEEIAEAKKMAMARMLLEMAENPAKFELVRRVLTAHNLPDDDQMVKEVISG